MGDTGHGSNGTDGRPGPAGPQGDKGEGFEFRGAYAAAAAYAHNDIVTVNGSSFVMHVLGLEGARAQFANATETYDRALNAYDEDPSKENLAPLARAKQQLAAAKAVLAKLQAPRPHAAPGSDPEWLLMAARGDIGPIGPIGATGPTGATGALGPNGPPGIPGLGFQLRGAHASNATYLPNDVVTSDGGSWGLVRGDLAAAQQALLVAEQALAAAESRYGADPSANNSVAVKKAQKEREEASAAFELAKKTPVGAPGSDSAWRELAPRPWPTGAILELQEGATPPAGFKLLGLRKVELKRPPPPKPKGGGKGNNHNDKDDDLKLTLYVYVKQ